MLETKCRELFENDLVAKIKLGRLECDLICLTVMCKWLCPFHYRYPTADAVVQALAIFPHLPKSRQSTCIYKNAPWYVPNPVIQADLKLISGNRLAEHPNDLAKGIMDDTSAAGLRK